MNRKLLVTLLRKDIQELEMITEGFMEMNEYPKAIIQLAQRKTEDIQTYIVQLSELKSETTSVITEETSQPNPTPVQTQTVLPLEEPIIENTIDADTTEDIQEEIKVAIELTSELIEVEEFNEEKENSETHSAIVTLVDKEEIETIDLQYSTIFDVETEKQEDEPKPTTLVETTISNTHTRNELLTKADNRINSILGSKKINDIKQAISIGERFRFQRELFRGNGEDMNKTLTYINLLATLEEAESFLQSKYGWESDNETAEDFLQLVRRKFL